MQVFDSVLRLVRNRTSLDYSAAFNLVLRDNRDLLSGEYDIVRGTRNFGRIYNRLSYRSGLSPVDATNRVVDQVGSIASRFLPNTSKLPSATQTDILFRAAAVLASGGAETKLLNRATTPEKVSVDDWQRALKSADDFFDALCRVQSKLHDRGLALQQSNASAEKIISLFKTTIQILTGDGVAPRYPGGLSQREAFDWLKENEPVFWMLAILSWEKNT